MWPARRSLFLPLCLSLPDVRNGIRDDLTLIAASASASASLVVVVKSIAADAADFAVGHRRRVTMDGDGGADRGTGGGSLGGIEEGCRKNERAGGGLCFVGPQSRTACSGSRKKSCENQFSKADFYGIARQFDLQL